MDQSTRALILRSIAPTSSVTIPTKRGLKGCISFIPVAQTLTASDQCVRNCVIDSIAFGNTDPDLLQQCQQCCANSQGASCAIGGSGGGIVDLSPIVARIGNIVGNNEYYGSLFNIGPNFSFRTIIIGYLEDYIQRFHYDEFMSYINSYMNSLLQQNPSMQITLTLAWTTHIADNPIDVSSPTQTVPIMTFTGITRYQLDERGRPVAIARYIIMSALQCDQNVQIHQYLTTNSQPTIGELVLYRNDTKQILSVGNARVFTSNVALLGNRQQGAFCNGIATAPVFVREYLIGISPLQ